MNHTYHNIITRYKLYKKKDMGAAVYSFTIILANSFEHIPLKSLFNPRCANRKRCINYYNDAVGSTGCFFNFLSLTSALCCSLQVTPLDEASEHETPNETNRLDSRYRCHNRNITKGVYY